MLCDFNSLMYIDESGKLLKRVSNSGFNDLHSLTAVANSFLLANTGSDSIERFDSEFQLIERFNGLSDKAFKERQKTGSGQSEYYDCANVPFTQRRLADTYHFNHAFELPNGKIVASSFSDCRYVDCSSFVPISNTLSCQPHDGLLYQNKIWISTVNGVIYTSNIEEQLHFTRVLDLATAYNCHGWFRGLLGIRNRLYIGVTAVEKYSSRVSWLQTAPSDTRTGILEVCMATQKLLHFYDLDHPDGARVFSMTVQCH